MRIWYEIHFELVYVHVMNILNALFGYNIVFDLHEYNMHYIKITH